MRHVICWLPTNMKYFESYLLL